MHVPQKLTCVLVARDRHLSYAVPSIAVHIQSKPTAKLARTLALVKLRLRRSNANTVIQEQEKNQCGTSTIGNAHCMWNAAETCRRYTHTQSRMRSLTGRNPCSTVHLQRPMLHRLLQWRCRRRSTHASVGTFSSLRTTQHVFAHTSRKFRARTRNWMREMRSWDNGQR